MYIYDFLKDNEHAINEREQVLISKFNEELFVNIILTNKKLLLFSKCESSSSKILVPMYKVLFSFNLDNLDYHIEGNSTVISSNDSVIQLHNFNLDEFIKL